MFHRLNVKGTFWSLVRQPSHRAVRSYRRKPLFLFGDKFVLDITILHISVIGFFFSQVRVNFFFDADKQRK